MTLAEYHSVGVTSSIHGARPIRAPFCLGRSPASRMDSCSPFGRELLTPSAEQSESWYRSDQLHRCHPRWGIRISTAGSCRESPNFVFVHRMRGVRVDEGDRDGVHRKEIGMICPRSEQCESGRGTVCEVRPAAGGKVLFLASTESRACPNKIDFADGQICTCPSRLQIYEIHGI